jgi:hypothetical protein
MGRFMADQNREVKTAISALTVEILKLSTIEGDAKDALCVTIENAFARLADAIMSQSHEAQEKSLEEALVDSH